MEECLAQRVKGYPSCTRAVSVVSRINTVTTTAMEDVPAASAELPAGQVTLEFRERDGGVQAVAVASEFLLDAAEELIAAAHGLGVVMGASTPQKF